ncbi:MAG: hypothetical protein FWD87_08805 [Spirochaetaceae bacterium]|nr:hypothetical protein [Spirochaetaceae bacterium]
MIIFYNYKKLLFGAGLFITFVIMFLCSCATFPFGPSSGGSRDTDLVELHIRDIFQEDIIRTLRSRGYNYSTSIIYSLLQEMFEEASISFFMVYNEDDTMQEIMKELAIIESAEKAFEFSMKKSDGIFTYNGEVLADSTDTNNKAKEKLFILSFSVKQLLINCVQNIAPLREQVEQLIEEKRWDMEYQEDGDSDLFFDIIKLENSVSYLNKIRRTLLRNIAEISKIVEKAEVYMKHYSD